MITIIRVKNPILPSEGRETREIEAVGRSLARCVWLAEDAPKDEAGFEAWAATVTVSVNGTVWPRSIWDEVTPKDGDYVVIAPKLEGGSLMRTLASVAILAGTIALTATTFGGALAPVLATFLGPGVTDAVATGIMAGALGIGGNLLINAFLGPSQRSNSSSSASYDPDGPKSLAQSGTVIPKGYGTFQWGGNIISSFTDIAGSDQFINVLVCFGFGPARAMTNVQINGKDISEYNNVQYYTRLGTNDQTEIAQFNQISNGYPQDTQCLAGVAVVVPGTGDLTQALQVDVEFPDGIFVNTDDGNIIPAVITYLVQYSVSGENDWQPVIQPLDTTPVIRQDSNGDAYLPFAWGAVATDLPPNSNVVYYLDNGPHNPGDPYTATESCEIFDENGNHTTFDKTVQGEWQLLDINLNYIAVNTWTNGYVDFVAAQTTPCYNRTQILGLAPNKYDVQITKYGCTRLHDNVPFGDNWSPNIGQDIWVHSVNEITYQDLAYPNMILLGVRALATSQLSGSGINVTALIQHGLRSLDQGLLPEALQAYEEDNPACVAADMMIDDLYGGGGMSPGIAPANLERFIDEWVSWAELNDTLVPDGNGNSIRLHVCNIVFDNESDLWTQLSVVTGMSRACIVPMGLDYGVSTDQLVDAPVQMFSVGNIIQDSFTERWLPIDDRSNQVEVQFADSTRYYKEDNPLVYMDPSQQDAGVAIKNTRIRGKGITIPAQVWHFARFKQRCNEFLLRSGSFRTDTDGIACRPFNVIALQHDVPQWGWGGRTLPGSTATRLLLDRSDVPAMEEGTSYSVMVQHAKVLRYSGTVSAVASSTNPPGVTVSCASFDNNNRVTRAVLAGTDCLVLSSAVGSIVVSPPPGFTPAAGQTYALYDTDVLESAGVAALGAGERPGTQALTLSTPLAQAPDDYGMYIYGVTGAVKWVRVMQIRRANELRSTIEWIDYDPNVYTIGTPVIGETSAQITSDPGVTSLTGEESFQLVGGSYVEFANLTWNNGPDTVGVGIYATQVGGTNLPQLVARLPFTSTSWQGQQAPGTTVTYTVVGYDANNVYASVATAPTVTIDAVGVTANLLLGSSFATGFTYWSITPRAGDSFVPEFDDDGQAVYTIAGTALTAAQQLAFQVAAPANWAVGDLLMLSGYIEDACLVSSAPNVGDVVLTLQFADASGTSLGTATVPAPLNGVTPTLTRFNTAATAIPTGTATVMVAISLGGTGLNIPVGSAITMSHFLLEVAETGQTEPSAWADIDVQGQVLDIFTTGSSTGLRTQGSVLPTFIGSFTYSASSSGTTISWAGLVILWPDGAFTYIQDGSLAVTGLSASTLYWAFLYFDIVNGGIVAVAPATPLGTPAILSAAYDANADAACRQDNRVALTPGGLQMTTPASGTTGGPGNPPGAPPVTCTVRGTMLATPHGMVSNELLKARFDSGEDVHLAARGGPERIKRAVWAPVEHYFEVAVDGFTPFGASESMTLQPKGGHRWCSRIASGTAVDTTAGFRAVQLRRVEGAAEVLFIELEGPSHEYLVVEGVWTHNAIKAIPG